MAVLLGAVIPVEETAAVPAMGETLAAAIVVPAMGETPAEGVAAVLTVETIPAEEIVAVPAMVETPAEEITLVEEEILAGEEALAVEVQEEASVKMPMTTEPLNISKMAQRMT